MRERESFRNCTGLNGIFQGEKQKLKGMKDLFLHTYQTDFRASLVVENKVRP